MTRNELILMVMKKMDELTPYDEGLVLTSDASQKPIEQTIDALLDECYRDLLMLHPVHRLAATNTIPTPTIGGDGSGYFAVPTGFLRFVALKMEGWKKALTELTTTQDPRYLLQDMEYVRGGASKPFAVRTTEIINLQPADAIHYWSLPYGEQHLVEYFLYIKDGVAEEITTELSDGLTWLTASKALSALGHVNEAAKAAEQFNLFNQRP